MRILFTITLFLSSALLFLIQPMIAKMILPRFGGSPEVWNTAMVFFQAELLLGYGYAHLSTRWLGPKNQAMMHAIVLLLPLVVLPIALRADWGATGLANPALLVLGLLLLSVGLPFVVVSAGAPLLQTWFATTRDPHAKDPYFLYSASNLGSMLALLAYPFILEPRLKLAEQSLFWTYGYFVLVALMLGCVAVVATQRKKAPEEVATAPEAPDETVVANSSRFRWIALAFVPSSLMLGVTTYLTSNVAPVPLLWIVPLSLYLLTFIIAFAKRPLLSAGLLARILPLFVTPLVVMMILESANPMVLLALGHLLVFFVAALMCHTALAESRPTPKHLTEFYFWISVGGVLGGIFNALISPVVFSIIAEYPIAVVLACLLRPMPKISSAPPIKIWAYAAAILAMLAMLDYPLLQAMALRSTDGGFKLLVQHIGPLLLIAAGCLAAAALLLFLPDRTFSKSSALWPPIIKRATQWYPLAVAAATAGLILYCDRFGIGPSGLRTLLSMGLPAMLCFLVVDRPGSYGLAIGAVLLVSYLMGSNTNDQVLLRTRSFFGVTRVTSQNHDTFHNLLHGTTLHGKQAWKLGRDEPLTYYARSGPIGQIFEEFVTPLQKHDIGLVGLGTGSLAAYGVPGMNITFFEIDPTVLRIASDPGLFSYLHDCKASHLNIVLGDARLSLKKQQQSSFDLLAIDAFSSDAIPMHLLTKQAIELYISRLRAGGVLAVHISNRYLNLAPIIARIGQDLNLKTSEWFDGDTVSGTTPLDQVIAAGKTASKWVLVYPPGTDIGKLKRDSRWESIDVDANTPLWTDDYSNLISAWEKPD